MIFKLGDVNSFVRFENRLNFHREIEIDRELKSNQKQLSKERNKTSCGQRIQTYVPQIKMKEESFSFLIDARTLTGFIDFFCLKMF